MQSASKAYKQSMKQMGRNRGYIMVEIGVINSTAQANVQTGNDVSYPLTYYSNPKSPFAGTGEKKAYATPEEKFSKVDGSMYFMPRESSGMSYYDNGIVSESVIGAVKITFGDLAGLDIKGLTIDFGDCYPVDFSVECDSAVYEYTGNNTRYWRTEDVFNGVSFIIIRPKVMVNGQGRLRIYQFSCGTAYTFTNNEVIEYSSQDYSSYITDSIPGRDISITVDNQDLLYSPDNANGALAYMEVGQDVSVSFGYDITGEDDIEWITPVKAALKTWTANDVKATFTATDKLYQSTGTYYRGEYRAGGISAYDLALDILDDMGWGDYYIDPYMENITIKNPIPPVEHTEALQILANACRCSFFIGRSGTIILQTSFTPDMVAESDSGDAYSHVENILDGEEKQWYAIPAKDFSVVGSNSNMYFLPRNGNYNKSTGFISAESADENGTFQTNPKITIELEAAFMCYGMRIDFQSVPPQEFLIKTYVYGAAVETKKITEVDLSTTIGDEFQKFDRMEIEFTKGYPESRVAVSNVYFEDVTDYELTYMDELTETPEATLQGKLRYLDVAKTNYTEQKTEIATIAIGSETITKDNTEVTVEFSEPSYDISATCATDGFSCTVTEKDAYHVKIKFSGSFGSETEATVEYEVTGRTDKSLVKETEYFSPEKTETTAYFSTPAYDIAVYTKTEGITCQVLESSSYYARIEFSGMSEEMEIEYQVMGKEYESSESSYRKSHNTVGVDYSWNNPLVDNDLMAKDLEEWLAVYYDGKIDYVINYRGDPRIDVGDYFYLELKDRSAALVKCFSHKLNFSGAWSGTIEARKVMNVYRTWDDVYSDYTWNTLYASGITWAKLKARI